ncbi:MAG: aminoacyl-tRNA hydrolase [Thermoguttaceae bacterium]|nr:aminoacyl-tRNA hydrolase [Thermoguttaceae bacterium]
MPEEDFLFISPQFSLPLRDIEITYVRSSGPGGQNVNKVSSKAVLRWPMRGSALDSEAQERFAALYPSAVTLRGEVVLQSQVFRDAPKNRRCCLEKLRTMLRAALTKPKKRRPTRPTLGSVRRRLAAKARRSEQKQLRRPVRGDQ